MAMNVNGSWEGVMSAAMAQMPKIMPRRHDRIWSVRRMPVRLRNVMTTGNRKAKPNASSMRVTKDR